MSRVLRIGGAQMGPIQKADSRQVVVGRMLDLLERAEAEECDLVVYPELALTTFFPRWYMTDQADVDAWFESEMPNAATRPLFDQATACRIALSFETEKSSAGIARCICPATPNSTRSGHSSTWRSVTSSRAISAFPSGAPWAASSECASATTGAGRKPTA